MFRAAPCFAVWWLGLSVVIALGSQLVWYVGLEGQHHHFYSQLLQDLYPHSHQCQPHHQTGMVICTRSFPAGGDPMHRRRFKPTEVRLLFQRHGHPYDLLHHYQLFGGHVKLLVGNRDLLSTAWSYGRRGFDLSFENHALVCLEFWQGLTDQLLRLPCDTIHRMDTPITAQQLRELYRFLQLSVSEAQLERHLSMWQPWGNHTPPSPAQAQWFEQQQRRYNFSSWDQWQCGQGRVYANDW